jgi:hypothetical protein
LPSLPCACVALHRGRALVLHSLFDASAALIGLLWFRKRFPRRAEAPSGRAVCPGASRPFFIGFWLPFKRKTAALTRKTALSPFFRLLPCGQRYLPLRIRLARYLARPSFGVCLFRSSRVVVSAWFPLWFTARARAEPCGAMARTQKRKGHLKKGSFLFVYESVKKGLCFLQPIQPKWVAL